MKPRPCAALLALPLVTAWGAAAVAARVDYKVTISPDHDV